MAMLDTKFLIALTRAAWPDRGDQGSKVSAEYPNKAEAEAAEPPAVRHPSSPVQRDAFTAEYGLPHLVQ